jgi:hypothetical protein
MHAAKGGSEFRDGYPAGDLLDGYPNGNELYIHLRAEGLNEAKDAMERALG